MAQFSIQIAGWTAQVTHLFERQNATVRPT